MVVVVDLIERPHFCFIGVVKIAMDLIIGLAISKIILIRIKVTDGFFRLFL